MANIYGVSPPPGTITLETEPPSIRLGQTFYQYGAGLAPDEKILGARLWCPDSPGLPAHARIMLFFVPPGVTDTSGNLDSVPVRSVEVATTPGGWASAAWDAVDPPALGYHWLIAYEFVEDSSKYVYVAGTRELAESANAVFANDSNFVWSEHKAVNPSSTTVCGGYYRVGSGAVTASTSVTAGYGLDCVVGVPTAAADEHGAYFTRDGNTWEKVNVSRLA